MNDEENTAGEEEEQRGGGRVNTRIGKVGSDRVLNSSSFVGDRSNDNAPDNKINNKK